MSHLIVMNKHQEELDKPIPDTQELYIKVEATGEVWNIEVLSGKAAIYMLGQEENLHPGLNTMWTGTSDVVPDGYGDAILILDRPPLDQTDALIAALEALMIDELIPATPDTFPGTWDDFAAHPDAQFYINLRDRVTEGADAEEHLDWEEYKRRRGFKEPTPEEIAEIERQEKEADEAAMERGRLRFQQAKESV